MKVDKNGNKEFLDDGETINPEFDASAVAESGGTTSNKETEEMINRLVEERLSKIKSNLDKAYQERDTAVREKVRLEEEKKQAKMKSLEEEGKHKEVAEMKLAELQEKLAIAERKVTELSRDRAVRDSLTGLEFRNERSGQMAYRDIIDQLVQDPETGAWIHKSGVSIKDFVQQYSKNEDNSFLFRTKTNSGTGAAGIDGTPKFNSNKKITEMSTEEVLAAAAAGKLGAFNL
jgi:vacuolar-type H+-ATPase subunit E/Vma4